MVRGEGLPTWAVSIADYLGWQEPGLVIVAATVAVIFLGGWFCVWLTVDAPDYLREKAKKKDGWGILWGLLLIGIAVFALFLHTFLAIVIIIGLLAAAGMAKDWWKS